MIWVDYCILAVFAISILIGILRGFTREALGIFTWVFAAWLAWAFADNLAPALEPRIAAPELRLFCAMAALFLGGLFICALATHLIALAVRNSLLSSTDRTLGGGFGLVRAAFLVGAFTLVAGTMGAPQETWWRDSMLIKRFDWLAAGIGAILPQGWIEMLKPAPTSAPASAPEAAPPQTRLNLAPWTAHRSADGHL
jgi:membrane protein required for colicin V production